MVQGGDAQCRAAPAAYIRAHRPDNKTRSSCPTTSHWLHLIAHRAQPGLRTTTIPQQWCAEATNSLPSAWRCGISTKRQAAAAAGCKT